MERKGERNGEHVPAYFSSSKYSLKKSFVSILEKVKKMSTIRTMSFMRQNRTSAGHEVGITYEAVVEGV